MTASYELEQGRVDWQAGQLYRYGGLVEGTNSSLETFQTSPADRVATGQTDGGLLSGLQVDPLLVTCTDQSDPLHSASRVGIFYGDQDSVKTSPI